MIANFTNTFSPFPLEILYKYTPPPSFPLTSPSSLFPYLFPTLSVYVTHLSFFRSLHSVSLKEKGSTALICASENGHTEAIKALLTAPDINVNHTNVSLYLLIPPRHSSGAGFDTHYLTLFHHKTLAMITYHPNLYYVPHPTTMKKHPKCVCVNLLVFGDCVGSFHQDHTLDYFQHYLHHIRNPPFILLSCLSFSTGR